jgi:hypothetical protein
MRTCFSTPLTDIDIMHQVIFIPGCLYERPSRPSGPTLTLSISTTNIVEDRIRLDVWGSIAGRAGLSLCRPFLCGSEPTQDPKQRVPASFFVVKRPELEAVLSHTVPILRMQELCLHSPIRLHYVVLSYMPKTSLVNIYVLCSIALWFDGNN